MNLIKITTSASCLILMMNSIKEKENLIEKLMQCWSNQEDLVDETSSFV